VNKNDPVYFYGLVFVMPFINKSIRFDVFISNFFPVLVCRTAPLGVLFEGKFAGFRNIPDNKKDNAHSA
jgi:hypothetical protein